MIRFLQASSKHIIITHTDIAGAETRRGARGSVVTCWSTMLAGFELWVQPKANVFNEDGLPIYEIIGTDAQIVQFPLRAGRAVTCFSGAMAYMSEHIKMEVKLAGLMKTFGRLAGGGSLFQITYTNESDSEDGFISMTPDYPGVIVPINMTETNEILALRDSFLCSTIPDSGEETEIGAGINPANSVLGFCCSGVDFIVQSVKHGEWSFLMAMGTVCQCGYSASWRDCCNVLRGRRAL
eukprot:scaffold2735_cov61-Attheya_sp.AAC.11